MAKFLTGNELNLEVERIFARATEKIIIISPFIKLHDRYASVLRSKKENDKLEIIIVFGKNEDNISKSINLDDFHFLKEFPNIQIRYEKQLHAKYYANENAAILTSMNLYNYSQDNNIEAGVMAKRVLFSSDSLDEQAWIYFDRVIEQAELLFHAVPQYESTMLGLTKRFKESKIEIHKLTDFFENRYKDEFSKRKDFYETKKVESLQQIQAKKIKTGYCISTGIEIPFNKEKPMSYGAYKKWNKDKDHHESFCHFSGEPSNGETSVNRPILKKNWKKAQEIYGL